MIKEITEELGFHIKKLDRLFELYMRDGEPNPRRAGSYDPRLCGTKYLSASPAIGTFPIS